MNLPEEYFLKTPRVYFITYVKIVVSNNKIYTTTRSNSSGCRIPDDEQVQNTIISYYEQKKAMKTKSVYMQRSGNKEYVIKLEVRSGLDLINSYGSKFKTNCKTNPINPDDITLINILINNLSKDSNAQDKNDVTQDKNDVTQDKNDVTQNKNDVTQDKNNVTQNKNDVTQTL